MSETSATLAAVKAAMKAAMKSREKERLAAIRLIQAEFKRIEVDERIELGEDRVLAVLDKMVKQRRDPLKQYQDAGRDELAAQESFEIEVVQSFLPQQLNEAEIDALIDEAVGDASGMQAMGAVMSALKPKLAGRADMGAVSARVKARLTA